MTRVSEGVVSSDGVIFGTTRVDTDVVNVVVPDVAVSGEGFVEGGARGGVGEAGGGGTNTGADRGVVCS